MPKSTKMNGVKAKKTSAQKSKSSSSFKKKSAGAPQTILNFALWFEQSSGNPNVPRKRMMAMSGVKANTFSVTLCTMKKKGLVEYDRDTIRLTGKGRASAKPVDKLPMDNGSAQKDIKVRFKIGGKAASLFDQLTDGLIHDREAIIGGLGLKSKNSAAVMLCNLKKNGVIEYDKTTIKMTDICFPFDRPGVATNDR